MSEPEPSAPPTHLTEVELEAWLDERVPPGAIVLVDGRSGSGKSTFAAQAAQLLAAPVVHTDDLAWWHDPFVWEDELIEGVIEPWRRREQVSYRPPGWIAKDRLGSIVVPISDRLVIEGVGAGRASLARFASLIVWVRSEREAARARGIARDVALGRTPEEAERFWDEWMAAEDPFLAADQPWTRADLIVDGGHPPSDNSWQVWTR